MFKKLLLFAESHSTNGKDKSGPVTYIFDISEYGNMSVSYV